MWLSTSKGWRSASQMRCAAAGLRADELVAPLAGQGGLAAQQGGQTPGHGAQQGVAHPVAETVVDCLETIQIEEQHRQRPLLTRADLQGQVDAGGEQGTVGQLGEDVVMGQALDAPLVAQPLGDVAGQHHVAGFPLLAQRRHGQLETARLPGLFQVQLPAGAGALATGLVQRLLADLRRVGGQQFLEAAPGGIGRQAVGPGCARVVQAQQAALVVQLQQQVGNRLDHGLHLAPAGAQRPVGRRHGFHEHRPVEHQVGQHLVGVACQVVQVGHPEIAGEQQLAEHRQPQGAHQQWHVEVGPPAQAPAQQHQGRQADQDDAHLGGKLEGGQPLAGDEGARQPFGMDQEHPVRDPDHQQDHHQAQ